MNRLAKITKYGNIIPEFWITLNHNKFWKKCAAVNKWEKCFMRNFTIKLICVANVKQPIIQQSLLISF